MQRSKSSGQNVAVEVAAHRPVEIGTKGTVGSLVLQEIEYFDRVRRSIVGPVVAAEKKKKGGGSKLVASICSMAENRPNSGGFYDCRCDRRWCRLHPTISSAVIVSESPMKQQPMWPETCV
ncbi:hypothetical protein F3Y22_tig00110865pilonHSYRG00313 [Hibiscus syriacus]|uniref:Uncharacterized protein n=1 Tax=Hibiscus syriacus TaxID=106335 RepID=A0A6A2ZIN2_HIBSY|nr:hypothetical protein F3Y22_tig00110865pilonHSYRG00313 [Hibiscus syriacus]